MIRSLFIFPFVAASCFIYPVQAQPISPDGTLNTIVTTANDQDFNITQGTVAGAHLFHSFRDFSIPTHGSATFDLINHPNVRTIFNRVTGSNLSTIDGLLQVTNSNHAVDVFLLNPNGILFGSNAQLNLNGSFIGTTATNIKFADGMQFGAETPPLLTISAPVGVQFGQMPGAIQVQGSLQVQPGKTLALSGGEITIAGGMLTAPDGRIELESIHTVQLRDLANLSVGNGSVQIQTGKLSLESGASINANVTGNQAGQGMTIWASDSVELSGANDDRTIFSSINSLVEPGATGTGSAIQITTPHLKIQDGAQLVTATYGRGNGGKIEIQANSVTLEGESTEGQYWGTISSVAEADSFGNGGDVSIVTQRLEALSGGGVRADTRGSGNGGNITVQADQAYFSGENEIYNSGLETNVRFGATGQGGGITLSANTIEVLAGARLGVNTEADGNAGRMVIQANQLDVIGEDSFGYQSGLFAQSGGDATIGKGGNIEIFAQDIHVLDGALITASSNNGGNAGTIKIQANRLRLEGISASKKNGSLIIAQADTTQAGEIWVNANQLLLREGGAIKAFAIASGAAGNIEVSARDLKLVNGGEIVSYTYGDAQGGSIRIDAETSEIGGRSQLGYVSLISAAANLAEDWRQERYGIAEKPTGNSGSVILNARSLKLYDQGAITLKNEGFGNGGTAEINVQQALVMRQNSRISVQAKGSGNGGNLQITSPIIVGLENSDLIASAVDGRGGKIQIQTQGIFGLQNRDRLTPDNDITASSEVGINGTVEINRNGVDPNGVLVQLASNFTDLNQVISAECATRKSQFVITGRGGMPRNPTQEVGHDRPWQDLRGITSQQPAQVTSIPPVLVEATGWHRTAQGKVQLVGVDPTVNSSTKLATCAMDRG